MYDLAIIGGGINGCALARDAAGRGLSVLLVEMDDLASGTSSRSTKLIHGGLRYLEHYEFMLVRKSLLEREVLYKNAPHIIEPLRFIFPHHKSMRPVWLMRLGLFLYDHIGGRKLLPASTRIDLRNGFAGKALKGQFTTGFEYSDCRVDDARLVILNAVDAARRGADIRVQTELVSARRKADHWSLQLRDKRTGDTGHEQARILVNAAGPWAGELVEARTGLQSHSTVRKVKGSHIIVKKLFDHDRAYIFQNADQRIIFAIPWEGDFTLIGTTDVDDPGDPRNVQVSEQEISYLCDAASAYFATQVQAENIVWSFAGVRPLYGEKKRGYGEKTLNDKPVSASRLTRDYVLDVDDERGQPVLLSIFGGKITTCRKLAEKVLEKLNARLPESCNTPWTATAPLPGGDFEIGSFDQLVIKLRTACPKMSAAQARRVTRAYGTDALKIFARGGMARDTGADFGAGLWQIEVAHLMENEWARCANDILWRRSKLGLRLNKGQVERLDNWMQKTKKANIS